MVGRGHSHWRKKKWFRRLSNSLIWVGEFTSGREGKRGEGLPCKSHLTVQMDWGVAEACSATQ